MRFSERNQKQIHLEEFHAKVKCNCGEEIEKNDYENHTVNFYHTLS